MCATDLAHTLGLLQCNLNFTWATNAVCNLPYPKGHGPGDWGLPVIIIFVAVCGLYFVGFTYYRSTKSGASPSFVGNMHMADFWSSFPGLIKDGVNFIASGGKAQYNYTKYASIDEEVGGGKKKPVPQRTTPAKPAARKTAAQLASAKKVEEAMAANAETPEEDEEG
jgi:hypothetical protein